MLTGEARRGASQEVPRLRMREGGEAESHNQKRTGLLGEGIESGEKEKVRGNKRAGLRSEGLGHPTPKTT